MTVEPLFIEILPPNDDESKFESPLVEVYITLVEPRECGPLVKRLSHELPLNNKGSSSIIDLSHLKRVKKDEKVAKESVNDDNSSGRKRPREATCSSQRLSVLLGAVQDTPTPDELKQRFQIEAVLTTHVPARLPKSNEEHKYFQTIWPTAYFPNKTEEFRDQQLQLSNEDIEMMQRGMREAILDANKGGDCGTVILSPSSGDVVVRSHDERLLQQDPSTINPLSTGIILAIQAVSRKERQIAILKGMDDADFQQGQYLCTGYDVYTTREPTVFEAMALVHARIRRLVYGISSSTNDGSLDCYLGGISDSLVHALPGTNHKYRAFRCNESSDLWKECRRLSSADR